MSFLTDLKSGNINVQIPRKRCMDATLEYHGVWHQIEVHPNDHSKDRQVLNLNERSLADAMLRKENSIFSNPGEKLKDWLIRMGWLEVRDGVTVPVDAPEGCNARCTKCNLYDTCIIQHPNLKNKKEA